MKSLGHLLQYVVSFAVSRLAGAGGYGTFALYQSVVAFFAQTGRVGLDSVLMFEAARNESSTKAFRSILKITLPLALLLSVALWFLSDYLATSYFQKPSLGVYLKWSSLAVVPLCIGGLNASYLKGLRKFEWFNFVQYIGVPLFILLGFVTLFKLMPVEQALLVAFVAATIFTLIISFFGFRFNARSAENESFDHRKQLTAGLVFMIAGLMFFLRGNIELYLAGKFLDESSVGVYRASQQLANLNGFILISALVSATPQFASLFQQKNMAQLAHAAQHSTAVIMRGTLPIFIVIALFGKPLLSLFGEEFTPGYAAMLVMSVGQLINALFGPVNALLNACFKSHWVLWNIVFTNAICLLIGWFLIPTYGVFGAACVNLLGNILMNVVPFFMVKQSLGFYTINLRKVFTLRNDVE